MGDDWYEKILNICYKAFWPTFILWCFAAVFWIVLQILG